MVLANQSRNLPIPALEGGNGIRRTTRLGMFGWVARLALPGAALAVLALGLGSAAAAAAASLASRAGWAAALGAGAGLGLALEYRV